MKNTEAKTRSETLFLYNVFGVTRMVARLKTAQGGIQEQGGNGLRRLLLLPIVFHHEQRRSV
jgi:hypothetical protein